MNQAAAILERLLTEGSLIKTRDGREMIRTCREIIRGSHWEEYFYPDSVNLFERKSLREAQEILKGTEFDYWSKK